MLTLHDYLLIALTVFVSMSAFSGITYLVRKKATVELVQGEAMKLDPVDLMTITGIPEIAVDVASKTGLSVKEVMREAEQALSVKLEEFLNKHAAELQTKSVEYLTSHSAASGSLLNALKAEVDNTNKLQVEVNQILKDILAAIVRVRDSLV